MGVVLGWPAHVISSIEHDGSKDKNEDYDSEEARGQSSSSLPCNDLHIADVRVSSLG